VITSNQKSPSRHNFKNHFVCFCHLPGRLAPFPSVRSEILTPITSLIYRANFDFRSSLEGSALEPLHGFVHRAHLPHPVARDQFLVSAKGPSITARCSPEKLTRVPFEVGCRPSPASITPALTSCSLYFRIQVRISESGRMPASDSSVAFTRTMTRMLLSPLHDRKEFEPSLLYTSNEEWSDRQAFSSFLGRHGCVGSGREPCRCGER
jgi:hypothetical protein